MLKLLSIFVTAFAITFGPQPHVEIVAEPIPYLETNLRRDFIAPASEYSSGHRGIDIFLEPGQQITSPVAGIISFSGNVVNRQVLTISSTTNRKYTFEPVCTNLKVGDSVRIGQEIGSACEPDDSYLKHCDGCIHFSVRSEFGYLSPLYVLGRLNPSSLLA